MGIRYMVRNLRYALALNCLRGFLRAQNREEQNETFYSFFGHLFAGGCQYPIQGRATASPRRHAPTGEARTLARYRVGDGFPLCFAIENQDKYEGAENEKNL